MGSRVGFGAKLFVACVTIFATLLLSSQLASAQFTQQGPKLVGTGAVPMALVQQGSSVAVSADGTTAIVGGPLDNNNVGAAWVYTRSNGVWTQQGSKLVGTGGGGQQGTSVALSADGNTAIMTGTVEPRPGRPGSSLAAAGSGPSRAARSSAPAGLASQDKAPPSRCPPTATPPSWAGLATNW
jgi:hypothetical protein